MNTALLPLAFLLAASAAAQAPERRALSADDVLTMPRVSDPQISPDGATVAYTVGEPSFETNRTVSHVWTVPMTGGAPAKITSGDGESGPRWSPDGSRIAYVAKKDGVPQVFTMKPDGSDARALTSLSTGADGPVWSPDGSTILFASEVLPGLKDDAAQKAKADEIEKAGVKAQVFDGLLFRHWNAFRDGRRSQLFVAKTSDGAARRITRDDREAPPFDLGGPQAYAFSADGKSVWFTRGPAPEVEAWSTNADLCVVSIETGETRDATESNLGWDGSPCVSPDGRLVAYRSQARDGYESDLFRLMLLEVATGTSRRVATSLEDGVEEMFWSPKGDALYVSVEFEGSHAWYQVDPGSGAATKVFDGPNSYSAAPAPNGDEFVAVHATLVRAPEIYKYSGSKGRFARLTNHTTPTLKDRAMPERYSDTWAGANGERVQGWVLTPPGFDPHSRYPMIVFIHGGPQGAWMDAWSTRWNPAIYAAQGYVVFAPNPHGSTGFGRRFCEQISGDWGGACFEDIERGVDAMIESGFVDASRLGAAGGSFGGYMVDWILGHDHRFKALVSHAGVYDLEAMYGGTEELWFPEFEFKGPPWENPELYRKWSPHRYAAAFKTPTLVIHGELDYRVPVGQGFELYTTLKRKGVPARMLYFPDEGHWVLKPRNARLWNKTVSEWFERWLKPAK